MIHIYNVLEFIKKTEGKIFSIKFIKRTTGELREMVCRTGVKKHLVENPTRPGLDFVRHDLIPVFDMKVGAYRSIPIEGIREIKIEGVWHTVTNDSTINQNPVPIQSGESSK